MTHGIAKCVLACLGAVASLAAPAGRPTAVFTLDAQYSEFADVPGKSLKAQFQSWALTCDIVPHEGVFLLDCPPPLSAEHRRETLDDSEAVQASLVLFRDLDEVVYLAGCPVFEKESAESERDRRREQALAEPAEKPSPFGVDERDARDCRELAAGHTFSTEVERDSLKIVVRGRQLALTLFRVRPRRPILRLPISRGHPTCGKLLARCQLRTQAKHSLHTLSRNLDRHRSTASPREGLRRPHRWMHPPRRLLCGPGISP